VSIGKNILNFYSPSHLKILVQLQEVI